MHAIHKKYNLPYERNMNVIKPIKAHDWLIRRSWTKLARARLMASLAHNLQKENVNKLLIAFPI